jgi:hypothetical protein
MQGISAGLKPTGFFSISIIEFFLVHQYDSMLSGNDCFDKKTNQRME